jgi:hypothetical protein
MIDREAEGSDSLEVRNRRIGFFKRTKFAVITGIYAHALHSRRYWLRSWIFLT